MLSSFSLPMLFSEMFIRSLSKLSGKPHLSGLLCPYKNLKKDTKYFTVYFYSDFPQTLSNLDVTISEEMFYILLHSSAIDSCQHECPNIAERSKEGIFFWFPIISVSTQCIQHRFVTRFKGD